MCDFILWLIFDVPMSRSILCFFVSQQPYLYEDICKLLGEVKILSGFIQDKVRIELNLWWSITQSVMSDTIEVQLWLPLTNQMHSIYPINQSVRPSSIVKWNVKFKPVYYWQLFLIVGWSNATHIYWQRQIIHQDDTCIDDQCISLDRWSICLQHFSKNYIRQIYIFFAEVWPMFVFCLSSKWQLRSFVHTDYNSPNENGRWLTK